MQKKYETLLTISLTHEYYDESQNFNYLLSPDENTSKLLRDHKILFKQLGSDYVLLQEGIINNQKWEPILSVSEQLLLSFEFSISDNQFQHKTDIDFYSSKDKKFFLTHLGGLEEKEYLLNLFPYRHGSVMIENKIDHQTNYRCSFFKPNFYDEKKAVLANDKSFFSMNQSGTYTIYPEHREGGEYFVWTRKKSSCDGVIAMAIDNRLNQEFNFCFPSRNIQWRYEINGKYRDLTESIVLKEELERIHFTKEKITENKYAFTSSERIKLKYRYPFSFQVISDNDMIYNNIGTPVDTFLITDPTNVNKLLLLKRVIV
tara:strand:+ start:63 stop:1010 length:948 start_codon:yes stop_codon:yes gene_type:complete